MKHTFEEYQKSMELRNEAYKACYQRWIDGREWFLCQLLASVIDCYCSQMKDPEAELAFPEFYSFNNGWENSDAWLSMDGDLLTTKSGKNLRKTVLELCIAMTE